LTESESAGTGIAGGGGGGGTSLEQLASDEAAGRLNWAGHDDGSVMLAMDFYIRTLVCSCIDVGAVVSTNGAESR